MPTNLIIYAFMHLCTIQIAHSHDHLTHLTHPLLLISSHSHTSSHFTHSLTHFHLISLTHSHPSHFTHSLTSISFHSLTHFHLISLTHFHLHSTPQEDEMRAQDYDAYQRTMREASAHMRISDDERAQILAGLKKNWEDLHKGVS